VVSWHAWALCEGRSCHQHLDLPLRYISMHHSTLAHGFKGESEDAMVRVGTASVTPDTIHVSMRYGRAHRLHPAGNRPWHRGGVIQVIAVPADRQSQGPVVPGSNANVHPRWQ